MDNKKTLRIASGICFVLLFVLSIVGVEYSESSYCIKINDYWQWTSIAYRLYILLIAIAVFTKAYGIGAVGCGIGLIQEVYIFIEYIPYYGSCFSEYHMPLRYDVVLRGCLSLFIDDIFTILISMLLLLSFLMQRKKKGRGLALIAAAPQTIIFIVCDVIMMEMFTFDFDGATLFIINHTLCDFLLPVAGYLLLGLSMEPRIATNNALSGETVSVAPNASGVNTIEKLTRLKALLDAGAITQEEFDAKKKQLLGL